VFVLQAISRILSFAPVLTGSEASSFIYTLYPPGSRGQRSGPGLFELSPRKVCQASRLLELLVGSYPTFSPLLSFAKASASGLFSAALSVNMLWNMPPTVSHGAMPCGVRTFLP
jgi:hypothetical protein